MADDIPATDPPATPDAPLAAIVPAPDLAPTPTPEAAPAPPVADAPPTVEERATVVALDWLTNYLTNSPVSREQVCWDHVVAVLPDLIALIAKEL